MSDINTQNLNIPGTPKRGMNTFFKLIIVLISTIVVIILAILFALFVFKYVRAQFDKTSDNITVVKYSVSSPESLDTVSSDLKAKGVITSPFWLKMYFKVRSFPTTIQPGLYEIQPHSKLTDVAQDLNLDINSQTVTIRIQEGSSINDIAAYLAKNTSISKTDFISAEQSAAANYDFLGQSPKPKTLEGYLFPDTYYIDKNSTADEVIAKMLDDTANRISPQMRVQASSKNMTIQQVIIVASLIEKEIGGTVQRDPSVLQTERETVAGIIYNRLQKGMALQLDSTKLYMQPGSSIVDPTYDTYVVNGLPPGPIANPSLNAINAALNPIKSDYLYFVTAKDGTAYFASTLKEQDANIAKYLGK